MILKVVNKMLDPHRSSKVLDEENNSRYMVKGRLIGSKKSVTDLDDNVLYKVKNKRIHFIHRSAYVLDTNGKIVLKITDKKFATGFVITDDEGMFNIELQGWLTGTNSIFYNGELIGIIRRKVRVVDTFELDIENDVYAPLLIAITIAIDNIWDKKLKIKKPL